MTKAHILFATVPVAGHVAPFVPLAKALVADGHDVRWYTGAKYRARVESTGARFLPYTCARDFDDSKLDEAFPERKRLGGLAQLKFDMKHVFIDWAPAQLEDLHAISRDFSANVIVHDTATIGPIFHHERGGPPSIVLGVLPMVMSSVDTAPFGFGLEASATLFGKLRNRALNWFVQNVAMRDVQNHWNTVRARIGLPPTGWWMDQPRRATWYVQPSIPSLEYPRSDLAKNVRFIGMMPSEPPANIPQPAFAGELDGPKPIVHVTQGTIANTSPDLIAPTLEGLANEDVLVVVSTGNRPVESLGLGKLPKNARVSTFLSYPDLLPKTSVMVTNGGYGGVQTALSYGVPLVVAGTSEDKPEVAARVSWTGAGVNLKTAKPKPEAVRRAVRAVLDDSRYRNKARELASEYRSYDAVSRFKEILAATVSAN